MADWCGGKAPTSGFVLLCLYWICVIASSDKVQCGRNGSKLDNDIQNDLECPKNGSIAICPTGTSFDEDLGKCSERKFRRKNHKRQTAIVGVPCQENIDCQTTSGGAYCDSTKRCDCLPAYVNINSYCWQKSNPGQSCLYLEQCTSVTPNAYCGPAGVCQCNTNQPAFITHDGTFCLLSGECPTNGPYSKLRDPTTGTDVMCHTSGGPKGCFNAELQGGQSNANGEVYNCICPNPQSDNPDFTCPETVAGQPAIVTQSWCCPVRAMACIMPRDEGTFGGGTSGARWWYNSASRSCEALSYRGAGGNANNFQTKALCESYCKLAPCPRGRPEKSVDGVLRCSATTPCANTQSYCNTQGTSAFSVCCPTSTFICDTQGGIQNEDGDQVVVPDLGDSSYNINSVTRFYWDGSTQRCVPFTYRGMGGSYNNFQTEAECRSFCAATMCTAGEPLRDSGGTIMNCGGAGTAICPAKYECAASGVCCPTVNFVCSQPQAIGACSSFTERWWFNQNTRSCERFYYSGCQGNFNNFDTYQRCTDYCTASASKPQCPQGEAARDSGANTYIVCSGSAATTTNCPSDYYCYYDGTRYGCCPTRSKTCSVDAIDPGTACITPVTRWYYNSQTRLCEVFTYNGCDGNSNNFPTKIDCQDYCGVGGCPEGGEPYRETFNGQYRICGTGGQDCPTGHTCNVVTMGTTQRSNFCCPTRSFICTRQQDQGQQCGTSTLNRYYFNVQTRACEMFTYNGCGGNRNNFASLSQCLTYCNSAGCPIGTVAMQVQGTSAVTTCDANTPNSCAGGYTCALSTVLQQGVCCGSNAPPGSCPSGQLAYMDSFTSAPLQCQPNVDNSCPNGIFCQYSFALQNSFCCSTAAAQCPQGGSAYVDNVGGPARQCTPGLANACPSGYNCQASTVVVGTVTSATGYCCGQGSNVCGDGYAPYYVNNQAVPCVPNQVPASCVAPYTCRLNMMTQQGYCCVPSTQVTPVCPVGKEAYVTAGSPTLCTQNSPSTGCPVGYTCDLYQTTGSYYCCRFGGVNPPSGGSCPVGFNPLQPIQTCSPGQVNACPLNYFCNYDAANVRYVCCGSGVAPPITNNPCLPNNGDAYLNPATQQPQMCALGAGGSGCPNGYGCAYSQTMRNYYCCSRTPVRPGGQCPFGQSAFITAGGQAQTCVVGLQTCPNGYICTQGTGGAAVCCGQQTTNPIGGGDPYGCPTGNAYLYPGTRTPLSCTQNGRACPVGYRCLRSNRANSFQCCSNVGGGFVLATDQLQSGGQFQQQSNNFQSNGFQSNGFQSNGFQSNNGQSQNTQNQNQNGGGRRSCSSNWDCRDANGNVRLCVNKLCVM